MISYSDALRIVLESASRVMPCETVPLVLAPGRVLSEPIVAAESIPAAPNSAMDGYAIRADDVASAGPASPVRLAVVDESSAGSLASRTVGAGEAVRIMTGGLMPDGADAVIEVESTSEQDGVVAVARAVRIGEAVRPAGEDVRAGEEVLAAGRRLTPGDIGVLASLGVVNVPVRVPPKVGILSTGNEVVDAWRQPSPGQIRNSSSPALYAHCAALGSEPIDLGIARDDRDELEEKLEQGLRFDVLLTTGGVSAGAYDFVQTILPELGVDVKFHKVSIKPGKPILFGLYAAGQDETLVFALPGNPVSTLIGFHMFVRPALRALLRESGSPLRMRVPLAGTIRKNDTKRHFVRGILTALSDGSLSVTTTGNQSSGAMSSMSRANCLIVLPEESGSVGDGEMVEVEVLGT